MKKILVLILIFFTCNCFGIQSGEREIKRINGKNFFVYEVEKGDGWMAIAKKFDITLAELRLANEEAGDKLYPGLKILIPADKLKANDPYYQKNYTDKQKTPAKKTETKRFHIVEASQTLFSISKMYGVTVDQLKEWNNLKNNSISIGQKLIVSNGSSDENKVAEKREEENKPVKKTGNEPIAPVEEKIVDKQENVTPVTPVKIKDSDIESKKTSMNSILKDTATKAENSNESTGDKIVFANNRKEVNETGNATWIDEDDVTPDKYFALHRTAPIGTIIRITNLSNTKKIFVRVTGTLTDSPENEGKIIRISKASAEKLGETEKVFKVNLLYGVNAE